MGDEWKEKPLGEFTDDDRAAFMAAIGESTTPDDRAALRDFAMTMRNLAEFAQSDEAREMGEQVGILLQAAREVATSLKDELEHDTDLARELQGMSLDEALESGKLDELFSRIGDGDQKEQTPYTQAKNSGALTTLNGRLAAYSSSDLKDMLTSRFIRRLPSSVKDAAKAFDKTGKLNMLALGDDELEAITETHTAFLMAVVAMIEESDVYDDETTSELTFYVPTILRELGIDPRPDGKTRKAQNEADAAAGIVLTKEQRQLRALEQRKDAMLGLVSPFDSLVGIMPNGSIYRLLAFSKYDAETEQMTISTPFFFALKRHAQRLKGPQIHRFLHSSVANEKNRAAVELASRIIGGIVRRGNTAYEADWSYIPGGKVEGERAPVVYRVRYQTLIDECPMLKGRLEAIEAASTRERPHKAQDYNTELRRTFEAAYRIIAEKSELPERCTDLRLPTAKKLVTVRRKGESKKVRKEVFVIPTKSAVTGRGKGSYMVISHRGIKRG